MEQLVQPVVSPKEQVQLSPEGLSEKTAAFTLFQPAAQNRLLGQLQLQFVLMPLGSLPLLRPHLVLHRHRGHT